MDQRIQRLHELFDAGRVVPPVNVEDIDIVGPEFAQGVLKGNTQAFLVIAAVVDADALVDVIFAVQRVCRVFPASTLAR